MSDLNQNYFEKITYRDALRLAMHDAMIEDKKIIIMGEDVANYGGAYGATKDLLKLFGKGGRATVEQAKTAVQTAREAGIDTNGYFMLGLSPDTEKSMNDTIEFARSIPLDMMKFGVAIAFPGTKMFNDYVEKGLVRSFDWDEYMIYTDQDLFAHKNLSYKTIQKYMEKAYRHCILFNPSFWIRRFIRGIKTGEFFWDFYYALKFFFMPTTGSETKSEYYAQSRWPKWDFTKTCPGRGA